MLTKKFTSSYECSMNLEARTQYSLNDLSANLSKLKKHNKNYIFFLESSLSIVKFTHKKKHNTPGFKVRRRKINYLSLIYIHCERSFNSNQVS